jgi:hypothetical protein
MTKRRLGELLQAEGLVSEDQIRAALEEQRKSNLFLGEALVKLGFVSEEIIAQTIVQQFNLPFASALQFSVTPDVLNIFPERMYYEYQFLACDKIGRVLVIVGAGLMNHDVLDELERCSGCKVHQFVSTWKDIRSALEKFAKDFKKEQSELTSLGTMLLDMTPQPGTLSAPTSPPAGAKPVAGNPPGAAVGAPSFLKPPANKPAAAASGAPKAEKSGLSAAVASNAFKPTQTPAPILGAKPPAAISGMNPQVAAPRPPAPSQKLSALAGFKPQAPAAAPSPAPASQDKNDTPAVPAGQSKPGESARNPAQPKSGSGLLGLFKKS